MTVNLSLENTDLYAGCEIERVAGRLNLITPPAQAMNYVGENIQRIVHQIPGKDRDVCVLTGAMAIWAYLVVFHAVVHAFREIQYDDGRNESLVVARHGAAS